MLESHLRFFAPDSVATVIFWLSSAAKGGTPMRRATRLQVMALSPDTSLDKGEIAGGRQVWRQIGGFRRFNAGRGDTRHVARHGDAVGYRLADCIAVSIDINDRLSDCNFRRNAIRLAVWCRTTRRGPIAYSVNRKSRQRYIHAYMICIWINVRMVYIHTTLEITIDLS